MAREYEHDSRGRLVFRPYGAGYPDSGWELAFRHCRAIDAPVRCVVVDVRGAWDATVFPSGQAKEKPCAVEV